ncbi:MAG: VWA domain-containing protein [Nocardioides sp.]|nr:VWA domain-containing protein [Nocardioides sp.]
MPATDQAARTGSDLVARLAGFARALREAGLVVGTGDLLTYGEATALLNPTDLVDLYWAGRTTLVTRRDQLPVYDEVFRQYYLDQPAPPGEPEPWSVKQRSDATATLQLPDPERGPEGTPDDEQEARMGLMASTAGTMRHRAFGDCSPAELAAIRQLMRRMRLVPPRRRSRRQRHSRRGTTPDMRRIVRRTMRHHGDPTELAWTRRKPRTRRLILILDVSGSMADYSRALLQFAHGTLRSSRKVEVFCFGTRLTRITHQLEKRRPDEALRAAGERVVDWEGGTRIGESIDTFVKVWGRRGISRGAIVVICSDGLERGAAETLDAAMQKLARLSHRIVWLNPHKGDQGDTWVPSSLGMMVAAPYVDEMLPGHDLASLEELAAVLPRLR